MKEREYKGWEIIKLLEEGKLKDGTKINVIKKEKYVCEYLVYNNKIYHKSRLSSVYDFPTNYKTPVDVERFASNNIFKIEKNIEYMTFKEAVATKKPLRLNEEWNKKLESIITIGADTPTVNNLLEQYRNGAYLNLSDMLMMLGWFLSGKVLRELISSNKKVWCVEE